MKAIGYNNHHRSTSACDKHVEALEVLGPESRYLWLYLVERVNLQSENR